MTDIPNPDPGIVADARLHLRELIGADACHHRYPNSERCYRPEAEHRSDPPGHWPPGAHIYNPLPQLGTADMGAIVYLLERLDWMDLIIEVTHVFDFDRAHAVINPSPEPQHDD